MDWPVYIFIALRREKRIRDVVSHGKSWEVINNPNELSQITFLFASNPFSAFQNLLFYITLLFGHRRLLALLFSVLEARKDMGRHFNRISEHGFD